MTFFSICIAFSVIVASIELLTRRLAIPSEISRKLQHIATGSLSVFLPLWLPFTQIAILGALIACLMLLQRKVRFFRSLYSVDRHSLGEVYLPLGIAITAWLFPHAIPYMCGVLVLTISDSLSGLVGTYVHGKQYSLFNHQKTYVGSIAFFVATFVIVLFSLHAAGEDFITLVFAPLYISLALTLLEATSSKGLDNLLLPPCTAFAIMAVMTFA